MFDSAPAYDRFIGRYSSLIAPQMADLARVARGHRVLDVGSGPGALTGELVRRLGADHVAAVDPSRPFVEAITERYPGVDVRIASAEALPFKDETFDAAIAQLIVHLLLDPIAALREMARVTRRSGVVAACVWDHAGDNGPLAPFWRVVRDFDARMADESNRAGARQGDLERLLREAGLHDVTATTVTAEITHPTFDAWWAPFEGGVGPAGAFVAKLDPERRAWLRERIRATVPAVEFRQAVVAWAAVGTVSAAI